MKGRKEVINAALRKARRKDRINKRTRKKKETTRKEQTKE